MFPCFHVSRFWHARLRISYTYRKTYLWPKEVVLLAQRLQMCRCAGGQEIMLHADPWTFVKVHSWSTPRSDTKYLKAFAFDIVWPLFACWSSYFHGNRVWSNSWVAWSSNPIAYSSGSHKFYWNVPLQCGRDGVQQCHPQFYHSAERESRSTLHRIWCDLRKGEGIYPEFSASTFKCSFTSWNYTTQFVVSHDGFVQLRFWLS